MYRQLRQHHKKLSYSSPFLTYSLAKIFHNPSVRCLSAYIPKTPFMESTELLKKTGRIRQLSRSQLTGADHTSTVVRIALCEL